MRETNEEQVRGKKNEVRGELRVKKYRVSSALSFIGGVHIGAVALRVPNC
jgi:hypothetical protein